MMLRGSSQSQSTSVFSRGGLTGAVPCSNVVATTDLRCRRTTSDDNGGGWFLCSGGGRDMLKFCTDDAPGLKIMPTVVLVMSLCFIGFITTLHGIDKMYRYRSRGA